MTASKTLTLRDINLRIFYTTVYMVLDDMTSYLVAFTAESPGGVFVERAVIEPLMMFCDSFEAWQLLLSKYPGVEVSAANDTTQRWIYVPGASNYTAETLSFSLFSSPPYTRTGSLMLRDVNMTCWGREMPPVQVAETHVAGLPYK